MSSRSDAELAKALSSLPVDEWGVREGLLAAAKKVDPATLRLTASILLRGGTEPIPRNSLLLGYMLGSGGLVSSGMLNREEAEEA